MVFCWQKILNWQELAELVDVSQRTVQRWVYEGYKPNDENKEKISELLNILENILFSEYAYKGSKIN